MMNDETGLRWRACLGGMRRCIVASQIPLAPRRTKMPALGDITNRKPQSFRSTAVPAKKPVLLACVANGNLRSRLPIYNDIPREKDDVTMHDTDHDTSCNMSVSSTDHDDDDADALMASVASTGDTTVRMQSSSRSAGVRDCGNATDDEEDSTNLSTISIESILDSSTTLLKLQLEDLSPKLSCARAKSLIEKAIELDTGGSNPVLNVTTLESRDSTSRNNISSVLGRGGFKLVLEDNGKALAVFLKREEKKSDADELLAYQEILASLLLSAHRSILPNFLHVDNIFRTYTYSRRFSPEMTIAFRMEKCSSTLETVLGDNRLLLQQIDQYFFQLCCGLAYMHSELNVYHLDLKPSNCLLTSLDGNTSSEVASFQYRLGPTLYEMYLPKRLSLVKIADLGSSMSDVSTYDQVICGTPTYRPPEYFLWGYDAPAGSATDVWAVGLMMFEAYIGIDHIDFIEREMDMNDELEDYLIEYLDTSRLCRLLYGYFVLFSTRDDISLYRRCKIVDDGWLAGAGSFTHTFVSLLTEDDQFQENWNLFSIQDGSDDSMVRLRSHLDEGDTSEGTNGSSRLDTFLSMLSIDPVSRLSAGRLATSPLFQHMVAPTGPGSKKPHGNVICRLGQELFE